MKALWKSHYYSVLAVSLITAYVVKAQQGPHPKVLLDNFDHTINSNGKRADCDGRQIFRFDTFGDKEFWGKLHSSTKPLKVRQFGGVGPGVSPATAAAVGLRLMSTLSRPPSFPQ